MTVAELPDYRVALLPIAAVVNLAAINLIDGNLETLQPGNPNANPAT